MSVQPREKLEEILNDKEYQVYYNDSKGLIETLFERLQAWLGELLAQLFPSLGGGGAVSGFVYLIVIVAIITLLAFILVTIGRNAKSRDAFRDHKPLQEINEMNWTYNEHLKEAVELESKGEYTLATRHLFLALLLYFHDKRWLEARIWKTNWEYYEELQMVNKHSAEFFYRFVLLFDQITYGKRKVNKGEYDQYFHETKKWLEMNEQFIENE